MEHQARRVVAQYDSSGHADFAIDQLLTMQPIGSHGTLSSLMWATESLPIDNMDDRDAVGAVASLVSEGGTAIRILDVSPDEETPMHRTLSMDYVVITKGEIDLELEGGATRRVRAGDIVVQRGTNHRWINRSGAWMQMIAILVSAKPIILADGELAEIHI